jgi:2-C-methyl-D-erythritol 4-phosphate cytidylyltransferase/2-C-methyl-D-erythritol 2,4-cyclodiphosphate synthase
MRFAAILAAAGTGERAGAGAPKQFRPLLGLPVLQWSVRAFEACAGLERLIIVAGPGQEARAQALAPNALVVTGGADRLASVRAGIIALGPNPPEAVLIHDAARPGLTAPVIEALLAALATADAAAPCLPSSDSLRRIDPAGALIDCPPRAGLVRVQTPQAFRTASFTAALAAFPADRAATDDLEIAHAFGLKAHLIPGDARLHKLTHPEDFAMLAALLAPVHALPRIGSGFDAHRFGPGDHVTLCGVHIPHSHGLVGHSDADAGWHALTDALLGAIAAGDIGDHFPPTDPQWRGAASIVFLQHAAKLVCARGGAIANVDVTLICERPKIKPHRAAMQAATAEALGIGLDQVSIKATTTEEMGFTGRSEGLAAQASVCVLLSQPPSTDASMA